MSFLRQLNDAISRGTAESRLKALWHATDILIAGRYSEDQIWIFGEVIGRLAEEIEVAARAQLAERLAFSDNAPIYMINKLAFDDAIELAGSVLRHSKRLDVRALVANAQSKSQDHLLAISQRKSINEPVTDVLVERGDRKVVNSVAANAGARFSQPGFLRLIKRSENDSILAEHLGRRRDIPRHLFQQLIAKASEDVSRKLEHERPDAEARIHSVVTDVTGALHAKFGPASKSYFAAKKKVLAQHSLGILGGNQLLEYAQSRQLDEVIIALSLLCGLPADVVERALVDENRDMTLILAKALDLTWTTTMSLLFLGAPDHRIAAGSLENLKGEFSRLNLDTCKKVLETYRARKRSTAARSDARRLPERFSI